MSDHIPFDIQAEIMKRLPVKSLVRYRSVSKPWKSLIDSSKFINSYHVCKNRQQHHLFVTYKLAANKEYVSVVDDDTFPNHKSSLFAPRLLSQLNQPLLLGSDNGLLCFGGSPKDVGGPIKMVVLWNPTVRKSVGILIPNVMFLPHGFTCIGFGVCPNSSDPKLVKINCTRIGSRTVDWEVEVFTLSTRIWKIVSNIPLAYKSFDLRCNVSIGGFIYWFAFDTYKLGDGVQSNMIVSFDLKSDEFGEVCLPDRLVRHWYYLPIRVLKVKESLGVLEFYTDGEVPFCGVWIMKEGVTKSFTKMFNVKLLDSRVHYGVLGFRKNGEAIIEMAPDTDDRHSSVLEVCEPCSGRNNGTGINGKVKSFAVKSYTETLLLLDQSNSIIH